jgi:Zn ribbon nucleic-acid-binding protein
MRRGATCPACRGPGALVGYNRAPVEAVHLCLHCGGRFTVPLARAEEVTAKGAVQ